MLAPMEGVTDYHMRALLTSVGGFDRCVTEFLRVTDHLYPDRVFYRCCPELHEGGHTAAGTPVYVQLLGSDSQALAVNATKAVSLGAVGIDLNFGCPAKTVNRHGGGSALLRTPDRVGEIVAAVREAVDDQIPVTAKIRLGFDSPDPVLTIAQQVEQAGATELCIHARTRRDGYRPPAHWHLIEAVQAKIEIPLIVNGEIWSPPCARRAQQDSHCADMMLGRGALSVPDLALRVRADADGVAYAPLDWPQVVDLLDQLLATAVDLPIIYAGNRTKQWLTYLRRGYPQAAGLFERIKRMRTVTDMAAVLDDEMRKLEASPGHAAHS
jgi:tRNA-dihydrouridine synthase C